jgi:hypothetical protein
VTKMGKQDEEELLVAGEYKSMGGRHQGAGISGGELSRRSGPTAGVTPLTIKYCDITSI